MDYKVVDVFTSDPLKGNPLAVVLGAEKLTTDQMQRITRWINLSETTFLLPANDPKADYQLRIFTPVEELPFAGHPTLGSAHAALEAGIVSKDKKVIIQECKRGLIAIKVNDDHSLQFGIDKITSTEVYNLDLSECFPGISIIGKHERVDSGPFWLVVETDATVEELISMKPNMNKIEDVSERHNLSGICIYTGTHDIEMRTFAAGIGEDPVCGSGNAAVAFKRNLQKSYTSSQGAALERAGKIAVSYDSDGLIWIGGQSVTVINGKLNI